VHLRLGDAPAAVRQLRAAEAQGLSRESAKLLATAYYAAHQYKLFLQKIRQAMEIDPQDASPHYYLGRYYESDLLDFGKAEECFREALKRNDRHLPSSYHLGYAAEARGDWDTATRHYRTAADLAEKSGRRYGLPWQGLARIELQSGSPKDALPLARRAIDLGPVDVETQRVFARICSALELSSEAIRAWERVAELDTTDPAPYYQIFRLRQKLGQTERGKASLARYKTLDGLYGGPR
jgi:tetratricopeptide (TPR) repeat protein